MGKLIAVFFMVFLVSCASVEVEDPVTGFKGRYFRSWEQNLSGV